MLARVQTEPQLKAVVRWDEAPISGPTVERLLALALLFPVCLLRRRFLPAPLLEGGPVGAGLPLSAAGLLASAEQRAAAAATADATRLLLTILKLSKCLLPVYFLAFVLAWTCVALGLLPCLQFVIPTNRLGLVYRLLSSSTASANIIIASILEKVSILSTVCCDQSSGQPVVQ